MSDEIKLNIGLNEETSCLLREFVSQLHNNDLSDRLDDIDKKLERILRKGKTMSKELDALTAEIERNTEVDQSAILLIEGLAAKIEASIGDSAALQRLADSLKADSEKLATAVSANTPAEVPPAT